MLRRDFIQELDKRGHEVITSHNSLHLGLKSLGCPDLERKISIPKIAKFLRSLLFNIRDKESSALSFTFYGNMITGLCVLIGLVRCRFYPTVTGLGAPYSNRITRLPYLVLMYFSLIKSESPTHCHDLKKILVFNSSNIFRSL